MAVLQVVLLFGSETWVVTPWLEKALLRFHHQEVLRMGGMCPTCKLYGAWV